MGRCSDLVAEDFSLRIIFEMSISLVAPLNEFPEFLGKGFMVEEVVNPETRAGGLPRVRRADSSLCRADAKIKHTSQ